MDAIVQLLTAAREKKFPVFYTTAAKSYQLRPIIIREAVQDRSEIAHEWTLFDIQARFADVVGLSETLDYLRALK